MSKTETPEQNKEYESFLSDSCLQDFLRTIKRNKPATREENDEMFLEYQNGNQSIKDLIIEKNLSLVVSIVFRIGKNLNSEEKLEYIQSGIIGLIESIDLFDLSKGNAFSTYAEYRIQMRINKYRYNNQRLIRRPQYIEEILNQYRSLINECEKTGQPMPSRNEICSILNITNSTLKRVEEDYKLDATSLDAPTKNNDKESDDLKELIGSEELGFSGLLDKIVTEEILKTLKINTTPYEYYILYYRLISSDPKTLQELGDYFNVTKEAVRLTEERVKEKVRKMFADDHTLKRKYINDIKQEYPFESIKIEPCPLENYTMFFYIRDKFSPEEQTILKEILLSKLSFDSKRVATEIIKSEEYVIRKSQEIKKIIYKTSRDIHFKLFHNYFVKKYKNKIYHLELDSDISECLDIRNIVSEYWQDKTLEEVFEFASSSNIPYTKETLEIIKRFYGEASKKDIKYNKNRLERDVNYSIYGFIIHEIPHSKLYSTFLQNQNKFTQKQRDYLNAYVFKKKKKVPKNPLTDKYYYGTSAINKLILLYYRIEDYKNDNFSCEKYISIRNRCIKDIDKRGIKLLDLYYGINGNEMTIREIAEHLCEDATEVENDFRRAKNNAITIYLGTGQYNFDKTIYSKVLQDESLTLGNPHYQVARMFFLEGKSYEEIANEFEINPKFTARKVSELIKYACNAMDYYRFGITSTQKNYPKDFLIDVLKNAKYDKETKDIINTFIETKSTITTADIHKRNLEEIRNIIRKFNSLVTKTSIEQVEITKEDVELSVTEHESTNVLNEREKAILSLYYGLKNKYNPSGKIKYPIDIGELLGIKNNVGTAIRKAKEHVAAHKIGLLKTSIDFINREELESILRNKRIPLSKEDKNIIINAYGLYETEYLTIKEIAQKYSLAEPIARKRLYKGIITIKKYLNKEIEGEVLFETDIEPYLKYFILEDREILTLLYKEKKTQLEIEKNYGFSTHQFNTLLQKIRMHLSDLRSGISSGIDFDYFWSYALEKDLPFYGNQQLAAELCFLYYEKRLTQSDIVKYHHPELGDTTVSELIKEFTAAIIKHQHGIKKANEFSFEEVANYFNKNKGDFKAVRLKIYKRYFAKIKRNGPYTKVHPNKEITYDLIKDKYPNHFRLENTNCNQIKEILAKYGHTMSKETIKTLESLFGVTHANVLSDEEWEKLINFLGYLQLSIEFNNRPSNKNSLTGAKKDENKKVKNKIPH